MKAWRHVNFGTALLMFALLCLAVSPAFGDIKKDLKVPKEGNTQILELDDGSTLRGAITEVGDNEIKFKTDMGEMTIAIHKINKITEVSEKSFRGGQFWFPDPNNSRLLFSPTAKMMRKGQGYFSDVYLFFPSIHYSFTDNISLGAGMSIFPGIGMDHQLMYFMPKVGIAAEENLAFAVSGFVLRTPDPDIGLDEAEIESFWLGLLFGTATYGSDDHHLSVSLGYGFFEDELADRPAVIVGGATRVSRRLSLVSENWFLPGIDDVLASYGLRFFGESIAVDLAFFTPLSSAFFFPGIPYLGFVYNF